MKRVYANDPDLKDESIVYTKRVPEANGFISAAIPVPAKVYSDGEWRHCFMLGYNIKTGLWRVRFRTEQETNTQDDSITPAQSDEWVHRY